MTTLDEAFRVAIREEVREAVRAELGSRPTNAKALTRRQAEKAMGIGRSKLQDLIAEGAIHTVKDNPRLVPASEVERYCQPRRQKPKRRVVSRPVVADGDQDFDSLDADLRRGRG